MEGIANSEYHEMREKLQGAEYRVQVNKEESRSSQETLNALGAEATKAAAMVSDRDGRIYRLQFELAEAQSAMALVENRTRQSLSDFNLQLGMAQSRLADVEAKADAEYTAAAKFTVVKELMDEELHAANDEVIRLTAKGEQEKIELTTKIDKANQAYGEREKRFRKELSYESQ